MRTYTPVAPVYCFYSGYVARGGHYRRILLLLTRQEPNPVSNTAVLLHILVRPMNVLTTLLLELPLLIASISMASSSYD